MIYFDAGATTLEKPAAVGRAMAQATHAMSSPGRGSYPASRRAEETAYLCRQEAAELLGVPQPENVIITTSATHGLNIAIRSLLGPGDRVVISGYEHNAVTRPLHAIPGLSVTVIDTPLFRPDLAAEEFRWGHPAAAAPGGGVHPRFQRVRHDPAGGGHCRDLPGDGNAPDRGRVPVGGGAAGGSVRVGGSLCGPARP